MSLTELTRLSAVEAVEALARRDLRPVDLVDAAAARIEAVDGQLNALPTLCLDRARDHARALDAQADHAWLAGLPLVIKDLTPVAGVRTTYGSPIFADHVPDASDLIVTRLEEAGGVVMGKSNTPEFGAGAQTFNPVFGRTVNPWNTAKTCGGSSGGAAVALASGMTWLAQGTDLGGSLRTPAAFCGVVGLRPGIGLVPFGPPVRAFESLNVNGPMARSVADLALMLDAMVGPQAGAIGYLEAVNAAQPRTAWPRGRVAYSPDLGVGPVDGEVASITASAAARLAEEGVEIAEDIPDFSAARDTFQTLRGIYMAAELAPLLDRHRAQMKPDLAWNIEYGLERSGAEVAAAERARGALVNAVADFFTRHDLLLCPTAIVPAFDVEITSLDRLGDHVFETYVDWLAITFAITLTGCPALSIPCGLTEAGLPVGLQIVAPHGGEARLLAAGALLQDMLGTGALTPIEPIGG